MITDEEITAQLLELDPEILQSEQEGGVTRPLVLVYQNDTHILTRTIAYMQPLPTNEWMAQASITDILTVK